MPEWPLRDWALQKRARKSRMPAPLFWTAVVVAFPVALVVAAAMVPFLIFRKPASAPNSTPCGQLCGYARHATSEGSGVRKDWLCAANRGRPWFDSRPQFATKSDPHNCTMFERKEEARG